VTDSLGDLLTRAISAPPEGDDDDAVAERILDAALTQVAAVGVRRTTVDDVARRAGVGRITVFRRFGSKHRLFDVLAVREARRFFAAVDSASHGIDDPVERTVTSFVTAMRLARGHPLLDRLARIEPETVLAALAHDRPPVMSLAREAVAGPLRAAVRAGELELAQVDEVAEVLLRLWVSFLLLPDSVVDLDDESATRAFVHGVVAPILGMNTRRIPTRGRPRRPPRA
jgi:TetR/AcrR family transcriptional repressor of uid operon